MKKENIRVRWSCDYIGSVEDSAGNYHFWHAAWPDAFNKRILLAQVEHCGDYARRKTTLCITRCKSAEPLVTTLGPLYDIPEEVMKLIAADIIEAFNND